MPSATSAPTRTPHLKHPLKAGHGRFCRRLGRRDARPALPLRPLPRLPLCAAGLAPGGGHPLLVGAEHTAIRLTPSASPNPTRTAIHLELVIMLRPRAPPSNTPRPARPAYPPHEGGAAGGRVKAWRRLEEPSGAPTPCRLYGSRAAPDLERSPSGMKKLHDTSAPQCDSIVSTNSAGQDLGQGGGRFPIWPLGEGCRANL